MKDSEKRKMKFYHVRGEIWETFQQGSIPLATYKLFCLMQKTKAIVSARAQEGI